MESSRYRIRVISHNKTQDHIEYILSLERDSDGTNITFSERYSNLKALNDLMRKETNSNAFPKFPPKKFFGGADEAFLQKRQGELNNYFTAISNSEEFSNLPSLKKFIEDNLKKNTTSTKVSSRQIQMTTEQQKKVEKKSEIRETDKKLTQEDLKRINKELNEIVKSYSNKFIDMGYEVDQIQNEANEKKIQEVFKQNKILGKEACEESLLTKKLDAGDDNTFELIGKENEAISAILEQIKSKAEEYNGKFIHLEEIYKADDLIIEV